MRKGTAVFLMVFALACSSGKVGRRPAPDLTTITTAELQATTFQNAFDIVQALRPNWLRLHGATSFNRNEFVRVYLDDSLLGNPEQLRSISVRSIASMRYLDGVAATQRWGLDHGQGAIVVSTRAPQQRR